MCVNVDRPAASIDLHAFGGAASVFKYVGRVDTLHSLWDSLYKHFLIVSLSCIDSSNVLWLCQFS